MMPDKTIVKLGTIDGKSWLDGAPPKAEIYTRNRPDCIDALKDCAQVNGAS